MDVGRQLGGRINGFVEILLKLPGVRLLIALYRLVSCSQREKELHSVIEHFPRELGRPALIALHYRPSLGFMQGALQLLNLLQERGSLLATLGDASTPISPFRVPRPCHLHELGWSPSHDLPFVIGTRQRPCRPIFFQHTLLIAS